MFKRFVPSEVQTQFSYTGRKLSSIFSVKDKVREIHRSNLVYHYKSDRNPKCKRKVDYVGETRVRLGQRTYEHFVQDKKSAIRQHCKKCRHGGKSSDFEIIGTGYRSTNCARGIVFIGFRLLRGRNPIEILIEI